MKGTQLGRPVEILLVEDNPGDVELTREAFQEARLLNHVSVARDGQQAIDFLRRAGPYARAPRPDLILLDLNLPQRHGYEVLKEVKRDPGLARIPVLILTSSQAERDVAESYSLHANCFVSKPLEVEEFLSVVKSITEFWLAVVRLPLGDETRA